MKNKKVEKNKNLDINKVLCQAFFQESGKKKGENVECCHFRI